MASWPTSARCSTPACARDRPTPPAGARRFIDEVVARVRRAGATGEIVMRFDWGFWSKDTIVDLGRLGVRYTMAVRTNTKGIVSLIAAIDEESWVDIDYTPDGQTQVAECTYNDRRLVVRQAKLRPDWCHFGSLADLDGDAATVDAFHRHHAVVELATRDLKEGAGLEHVPSGNFHANSAVRGACPQPHPLDRHHWRAG